jgi:hypothetical protein
MADPEEPTAMSAAQESANIATAADSETRAEEVAAPAAGGDADHPHEPAAPNAEHQEPVAVSTPLPDPGAAAPNESAEDEDSRQSHNSSEPRPEVTT